MQRRSTNYKKQRKEIAKQAYREMKADYLKGIPVVRIAEQYNISRQAFYQNVELSKEDKIEHLKNKLYFNVSQQEENAESKEN